MRNTLWRVAAVLLALGLLGCSNSAAATPSPPPSNTPRPLAPTPRLETSLPTAGLPAVVRPSPTLAVPTPAPTPFETRPVVGGACTNRYEFVKDVSVPDGTAMSPGQVFTKTWRVRNTGTCNWGDGYTLAFSKGHSMTALSSVAVPRAAPGETADLSVLLTAPTTPGAYEGYWTLKNPGGAVMTPSLWVKITVP